MLNDDCILAIFTYLLINDIMNVADTYTRLQTIFNQNYKSNFSSLTIDENVIWKGIEDRVWYYYGQHLSSIEFVSIQNKATYRVTLGTILSQLRQHCVHLQEIKMFYCQVDAFDPFDQLSIFQNVEKLTIHRCTMYLCNNRSFFSSFSHLKQLCVYTNDTRVELLVKHLLIPNNNNIEKLVLAGGGELCLKEKNPSFLMLPNLTKLKLSFSGEDGDELLTALCEKGIKELQLDDVIVKLSTFDIIKSLDLQLLSISMYPWNYQIFSESFVSLLPSNMKHLRLCGFTVSLKILMSIIERLKFLEHMDVYECKTPNSEDSIFHDSKTVSQELKKASSIRGNSSMLTVTLPRDFGRVYMSSKLAKKKLIYVDGIQLVNNSLYYKIGSPFFDCLPDFRVY